jgi:murein L,D-transpeptidase YcbB/YkuD
MDHHKNPCFFFSLVLLWIFYSACSNGNGAGDQSIVKSPADMDESAAAVVKKQLSAAIQQNGKMDDSTMLVYAKPAGEFYTGNDFQPLWSHKEKWTALGDSLFDLIKNAELEGLFPKDYHYNHLEALKHTLDTDSLKRMDAALWGRAEILLTDGILHIIKDLKYGRMLNDSAIKSDSSIQATLFVKSLKDLAEKKNFSALLKSLQPGYKAYWELKRGIKSFLDSMDRRTYTYVTWPYKGTDDSLRFIKTLQKRLAESGLIDAGVKRPDSATLKNAITHYQKQKGITADGKVTATFIRSLNTSDAERFKRIAITLDRYKLMKDKMPDRYIWVNLPSYFLQVWDHDTMVLESKTIVGKPATRTPLLQSFITNMVTYPTWTVPSSIVKNYIPKLRNNPNYLSRLGLKLINRKGETISGGSVNWSKYSNGIPFSVMQNSGDNNALGVFKFNFDNPYAVYLHDTNQRYLFKNGSRALSHGCVRVQEWEQLANYIAKVDSMASRRQDSLSYTSDSIRSWISAKKHRQMQVKSKIGVYLRYFSCEGKNGKIKFYEDIYGEDKALREKYFMDK